MSIHHHFKNEKLLHNSVTSAKWVICPGRIRDVPSHLNTTCSNESSSKGVQYLTGKPVSKGPLTTQLTLVQSNCILPLKNHIDTSPF